MITQHVRVASLRGQVPYRAAGVTQGQSSLGLPGSELELWGSSGFPRLPPSQLGTRSNPFF